MVGEAVIQIKSWRDHVSEAERLLTLARTPDIATAVALSHLYLAVVEIGEALQELRTRNDD